VNEELWVAIEPAKGFIQQEPNSGMPATEDTEVRIAYDDDNLYFGVICFDREPGRILVTQNRRDGNLTDTDSIDPHESVRRTLGRGLLVKYNHLFDF
jgi:hypothetical protein